MGRVFEWMRADRACKGCGHQRWNCTCDSLDLVERSYELIKQLNSHFRGCTHPAVSCSQNEYDQEKRRLDAETAYWQSERGVQELQEGRDPDLEYEDMVIERGIERKAREGEE